MTFSRTIIMATLLSITQKTSSRILCACILRIRKPSVRDVAIGVQRSCDQARRVVILALVVTFLTGAQAQLPSFTQSFDPSVGKIEVDPVQNWCIFHKSEIISIKTSDNSTIRVFDRRGVPVYQGPPGTLPSLPAGHYFVECNGDRTQFLVLPDDYKGSSLIGMDAYSGHNSAYAERLAQVQPSWVRLQTALWDTVEPQRGVWDWTALDQAVAANPGKRIIVAAFIRPAWVTNEEFLSRFVEYVKGMAMRYKGKIYAIQIWNEPWVTTVAANGHFWGDIANPYTGNMTVDLPAFSKTLANLIIKSRAAIRSVTGSIKTFGPEWSNPRYTTDTGTLSEFGGVSSLDMFTFHATSGAAPDGAMNNEDGYTGWIDLIQPYLGSKPWLVSEFHAYGGSALGIPNQSLPGSVQPNIDWHRGMSRIVKTMVMWRAKGAQAINMHVMGHYSEGDLPNYQIYGWDNAPLGGQPRGPHPKTSAYLMSGYWLDGATLLGSRVVADKVYLYAWQRPSGERVVFVWSLEDHPVTIQLDGTENVTDIFGQPVGAAQLTEEPVLFHDLSTADICDWLDDLEAKLYKGDINRAPILDPISDQGVFEGDNVSLSVAGADPDNDPLTYSVSGLPPGALFDVSSRQFTWTPTSAHVGTWPVTFSVNDGWASTSQVVIIDVYSATPTGLAAYWRFDDGTGTTAADSAGSDPGTLLNFDLNTSSGWANTERGVALRFDGIDDFVVVSNSSHQVIPAGNAAFSVSLWMNPRNLTTPRSMTIMHNDTYGICGFRYGVDKTKRQLYFSSGQNGGTINLESSNVLTTGIWYHAVIAYTGDSATMYINGSVVASNPSGTVISSTNPLLIGGYTGGEAYFDGTLSDVMIFSRALGAAEIQALYQGTWVAPPATNAAPVWTITPSQSVDQNRKLTFTVSAIDPDGDPLTYFDSDLPSGATFDQTTRAFQWTPTVSQNGNYTTTFAASDGLLSATQVVTVTVNRPAAAPRMANIRPRSVKAGHPVKLRVKAKSPSKQPLTYLAMSLPAGAALDAQSGRFLWTPNATQVGKYVVTFVATDGMLTDTRTVTITVVAP